MVGLSSKKVELVRYSDEWIELYQIEAENLDKLLKEYVVSIQHIGSTSIPNMSVAKPIIDIAIGVPLLN